MSTVSTVRPATLQRAPDSTIASRTARTALALAGLLLGMWLLWPALHPVHVEALSARSQSLAILDMQGKLALDDQAYPVNIEYFFGLRLGTVKALEWIMRATHSRGDVNFHILVTASFLLLLGSSYVFARRWSRSPLWAAIAFAILTPGLVEIAFFFSDNLPSAALACLALALVSKRTSVFVWLLIGAAVAAATLCRSDGFLVLPGVLALSLLRDDLRWKRVAANWLAMSVGIAALFFLSWRATGMSLLHMMKVSGWIGRMHLAASNRIFLMHSSLTMFFGLPALLLLAVGAYSLWRRQSMRERLVLTIYPAIFYLYFMTKAIEPRNFLLLGAPFLVLHGAAGLRVFVNALLGAARKPRTIALIAAAVCLLLMAIPPRVSMSDGPRTIVGRLWSPLLWRQWQSTIQADMQKYYAFIDTAKPGDRILVVNASFQSERYLHLKLLQRGYELQPFSATTRYGQLADVYTMGDRTFLQVRTEQPFAIFTAGYPGMSFEYPQEFQLAVALATIHPTDYNRAFLVTWGDQYFYQFHLAYAPQFHRSAGPMTDTIPATNLPAMRRGSYGRLRLIPLSNQDVADIQQIAQNEMHAEEQTGKFPPLRDYAFFHNALSCRFCDSKSSW